VRIWTSLGKKAGFGKRVDREKCACNPYVTFLGQSANREGKKRVKRKKKTLSKGRVRSNPKRGERQEHETKKQRDFFIKRSPSIPSKGNRGGERNTNRKRRV